MRFLNSIAAGLALLATQVYGQSRSNLNRERYDSGVDDSSPPSWGPYLALGFVGVISAASVTCVLVRKCCPGRFFPEAAEHEHHDAHNDAAALRTGLEHAVP